MASVNRKVFDDIYLEHGDMMPITASAPCSCASPTRMGARRQEPRRMLSYQSRCISQTPLQLIVIVSCLFDPTPVGLWPTGTRVRRWLQLGNLENRLYLQLRPDDVDSVDLQAASRRLALGVNVMNLGAAPSRS